MFLIDKEVTIYEFWDEIWDWIKSIFDYNNIVGENISMVLILSDRKEKIYEYERTTKIFFWVDTRRIIGEKWRYGWFQWMNGFSNGCLGSVYPAKHFWDPATTSPSGTCTR